MSRLPAVSLSHPSRISPVSPTRLLREAPFGERRFKPAGWAAATVVAAVAVALAAAVAAAVAALPTHPPTIAAPRRAPEHLLTPPSPAQVGGRPAGRADGRPRWHRRRHQRRGGGAPVGAGGRRSRLIFQLTHRVNWAGAAAGGCQAAAATRRRRQRRHNGGPPRTRARPIAAAPRAAPPARAHTHSSLAGARGVKVGWVGGRAAGALRGAAWDVCVGAWAS